MKFIPIILLTLIVHIIAQYDVNTTSFLSRDGFPGTCTINQQTCMELMMNTEQGIKVINKKIASYFNQIANSNKIPINSMNNADLRKVISTTIASHLENRKTQLAIDLLNHFRDDSIIQGIVKTIFPTIDFNIIVEFLEKLRKPIAFHYVFNEFIKQNRLLSPEILQFAHLVKRQLNLCPTGRCLEILFDIKEKLPDVIETIVFSTNVCIKSVHFDEFLYAEDFLFREDRRMVFTKISDRTNRPVKGAIWKLEPIENATLYQLKNIDYNEYLYATYDDLAYDKSRRRVVTWIPGTVDATGKWKLELVDVNSFNLRNFHYKLEYFYPAQIEYDPSKRFVFTWMEGGCDAQCTWKVIEC